MKLLRYILDTVEEEFGLLVFGLEEVDDIRNADEVRKPLRIELFCHLFGEVFSRQFLGIQHQLLVLLDILSNRCSFGLSQVLLQSEDFLVHTELSDRVSNLKEAVEIAAVAY